MKKWYLSFLAAIFAALGWQFYINAASTLKWTPPTQNTDDSPLTDLKVYRIWRRASATTGTYVLIDTINAPATGYTDNATLEGVNCYVITAVDDDNNESDFSNQACKTIDTLRPNAPTGLTAN